MILDTNIKTFSYFCSAIRKRNAVKDNNFRVLRMANYPGVLIECGFLSNKNEVEQIKNEENQDKLVNKIVKSVNKYF